MRPSEIQEEPERPLVRVADISKRYVTESGTIELFRSMQLTVPKGELLAIVGESGAGKSTFLHLLAAMDKPSSGEIVVDGRTLSTLNIRQQAEFRNSTIGYVWQFHYLLPEFTAEENVAMPLMARGHIRTSAITKAKEWLAEVGLAHRANHRSGELSGGEQQRVSLARALITQPRLLLADEPTGDLDNRTAEAVFTLLERLHRTYDLTSIIVTHHPGMAVRCDRTLHLREGRLTDQSSNVARTAAQ